MQPHRQQPTRLPRPWDSPGKNTSGLPFPSPMRESEKWKGSRSVVSDSSRPHGLQPTRLLRPWEFPGKSIGMVCHFLFCYIACAAAAKSLQAAHQASPSLGFSRQEDWSGLPFPSPMHESEKWKWIRSVMSDSLRPHGLQPTRLLHPWDFPGKSTGVGYSEY